MTCGCGQTKGTIACRNGAKRDGQTVTRAVICAACPNMRQTGEHADAGVCSRSGYAVDEHTVYGLPCPEWRHPDARGFVYTPITIGRINTRIVTHGAPMWQRLLLWKDGKISTFRPPMIPGCGCIVRLKRRWRQVRRLRLWVRVLSLAFGVARSHG